MNISLLQDISLSYLLFSKNIPPPNINFFWGVFPLQTMSYAISPHFEYSSLQSVFSPENSSKSTAMDCIYKFGI